MPKAATTFVCEECGKTYTRRPAAVRRGGSSRHCSKACQRVERVERPCAECGEPTTNKRFCAVACYRKHTGETSIESAVREVLEAERIPFAQEQKIGRWSVDFLLACGVIVEVDGDYWHSQPGVRERDAARDLTISSQHGLQVIRLTEAAVVHDPRCVIHELTRSCGHDLESARLPQPGWSDRFGV